MTIARPVYAEKLPALIPRLGQINRATRTLFGPGLTMAQHGRHLVIFTPGDYCACSNCADLVESVVVTAGGDPFELMRGMIVCPTCGNKRCPHATDHDYECTGSNEPGQEGSSYEAMPLPADKCLERHSNPDPGYLCLAPKGHK